MQEMYDYTTENRMR